MKLDAFKIAFINPAGFLLVAVLAFISGVLWGAPRFSRMAVKPTPAASKVPAPGNAAPRAGGGRAEPEDYFPAAEFRNQSALLLGCYDQLNVDPDLYVGLARAIDRRLPVFGLVHSEQQAAMGRELMRTHGLPPDAMRFVPMPANTIWVRDYAPFAIRNTSGSVVLVDTKYGSGDAAGTRPEDQDMAFKLASMLQLPLRSVPLVLDGGNFLSNGDGLVVSTTNSMIVNNRYGFSASQVGDLLNEYLGIRNFAYVPPIEGESTGHIDMFATFLAKNIAVVGEIDQAVDPENHRRLETAASRFSQLTTSLGPMQVHRIPMPPKWGDSWRSYTNVIMANGLLIMPSFSDVDPDIENRAENLYRSLLPGWQVKRVRCDKLVKEGGQLHCLSYNIPRYVSVAGLLQRSGQE